MQPKAEVVERVGSATGQNLYIAVRLIYGVAGDTQSQGFRTRTVTEPDTLHAAFDRIQARFMRV